MTIMVITMANIKATTRTKAIGWAFAAYGLLLGVCALINLFDTFTPLTAMNASIDTRLQAVSSLRNDQKSLEYGKLLHMQEKTLLGKPSEPYAWARLSYLRNVTGEGDAPAFAALKMSDLVSPYEAEQLPERAVAWSKFANVQNKEEREYQDELWQKAFTVSGDATWDLAAQLGLTKMVGDLFARKNHDLADGWRDRVANPSIRTNVP